MSSQIPPPLVCQTPPPMDYGDDEEEDEVDLPDPDDDDFEDFAMVPQVSSLGSVSREDLPTPVPPPLPDFEVPAAATGREEKPSVPSPKKTIPSQEQHLGEQTTPTIPQAVIEDVPDDDAEDDRPRIESPPSLILSQHNFSENDVPSEDEFQDFAFHPHESQEDSGIPPGTEDNLSIPSLHLDTEVSKSGTPVQLSDNEASERNLSPQEPEVDDPGPEPEPETVPEAAVTPVIAEDLCYRFDDNTENDFTDFTTASNERSAVLEVPTANDVSFDDDFAQLESTPSADSNFVSQSKTDFATFDADFSKFDSFQASFPATFDEAGSVPKDPSSTKQHHTEDKSTPEAPIADDLASHDDFDDFQEFTKFSTESSVKPAEVTPQPAQEEPLGNVATEYDDDDDDDDFGEFSDFKQSEVAPVATSIPTSSRSALFTTESILSVIIGMFPSCAEETQNDTGQSAPIGGALLENKIYHELKDMDTAHALSFQYNSSESSKSLVRALGIDARNILFGPKWNSSMPRFAANLSFSPLEPLKPASTGSGGSTIPAPNNISMAPVATPVPVAYGSSGGAVVGKLEASNKHHAFGLDPLQPTNASSQMLQLGASVVPGSVPAVHFDWNSAGLVNPLEGVQEILQEGGAFQPNKNGPKGEVLDKKISENSGTPASDEVASTRQQISAAFASEAIATNAHSFDYGDGDDSNDGEFEFVSSTTQQQSTSILSTTSPTVSPPHADGRPAVALAVGPLPSSSSSSSSPLAAAASSNNVVRTIKLPETHIFTPSKGVSPISRDSTDRTEMYGEVSGLESRFGGTVDKSIVVREYHDVEYSLEKSTKKTQGIAGSGAPDGEDDFDDFREFQAVGSGNHTDSGKMEEQRWPEPRKTHLGVGNEFNFADRNEKQNTFSKPVFGTSPTEELDQIDDEFSEFQAAVPASEPTKQIVNKPLTSVTNEHSRSNTSSPLLLSPSILLPQQANPPQSTDAAKAAKINWPDPGVDPEELARFEAAFPTPKAIAPNPASNNSSPKHTPANTTNAADDDEWTDFVYSKPATEKGSPKNIRAPSSTANNQQEEWTDFIYSTPSSQNLSSSQNNFNYQNSFGASRLDGPKFSSWNQPQLPPPQFNSWNSNNFYYTPPGGTRNSFRKPPVQTQQVPTFPSAHAPAPAITSTNNYYHNHHHAPTQPAVPSNQTQRVGGHTNHSGISHMPELSFITPNAPAGSTAPGVKPLSHSFLSNVISSNNFTKK